MRRISGLLLLCTMNLSALTLTVPQKYYNSVMENSEKYQVPVQYLIRLIEWESGWDSLCISSNKNGTTDLGLMQLNSAGLEDLARWHNGGIPFDPMNWEVNLIMGIKHLRFLYERTGSWWSAIASYNMGLSGFNAMCEGKRKLPEGTKKELDYVFK